MQPTPRMISHPGACLEGFEQLHDAGQDLQAHAGVAHVILEVRVHGGLQLRQLAHRLQSSLMFLDGRKDTAVRARAGSRVGPDVDDAAGGGRACELWRDKETPRHEGLNKFAHCIAHAQPCTVPWLVQLSRCGG